MCNKRIKLLNFGIQEQTNVLNLVEIFNKHIMRVQRTVENFIYYKYMNSKKYFKLVL